MKVKGLKLTYYMKNGSELVDESLRFKEPVDEYDTEFKEFMDTVRHDIKTCVKSTNEGHIAYGSLYVRVSEVNAVRLEIDYR